ncbi:MAG: M12 family metallopeptidase [Chitinophagaceae bacterium]
MKKKCLLLPVLFLSIHVMAQFQKVKRAETSKPVAKPVLVEGTPAVFKNTIPANTAYDFRNVRICVDEPATTYKPPPRNTSNVKPIPVINADGSLSTVGVIRQGLVAATEKMWNPGDVITVYMNTNNGSDWIRNRVMFYAKQWEGYANVKFNFITDFNAAQIKVGFQPTGQSWSWIGRDVLYNPFKKYTINFGWFDQETTQGEFSRVVMHEFGHALGFHHEHQSPASPLQWDLPKTYKYFKDNNNWSEDEVNRNIINKYSQSNTNFSAYDPNSIMHYFVPVGLVLNGGGGRGGEYMLSATDGDYAGYWYPFPPKGKFSQGNLRTNDDCDDVLFTVEYDVVAADKVEFVLSLGELNSKKVTWWKQVAIPLANNTEALLQVQNHSLIPSENKTTAQLEIAVNDININKGIGFWKAKLLGIHTLLDYKWNVLPAIKGGCRIKLVWNRDNCL